MIVAEQFLLDVRELRVFMGVEFPASFGIQGVLLENTLYGLGGGMGVFYRKIIRVFKRGIIEGDTDVPGLVVVFSQILGLISGDGT